MRDLPDDAVNPYAPAGTAPGRVARLGPFYCAHGTEWQWDRDMGGYMVSPNARDDELHPKDLPITGQGALPALCQPATSFDPQKYPNIGPAAVKRVENEVKLRMLRERRARRGED